MENPGSAASFADPLRRYLEHLRLERNASPHTVRAYDHDTTAHARGLAYGLEAARALGVPPERVFKTLLAEVVAGAGGSAEPRS